MKDKNTYHKDLGFKVPEDYFNNLEDDLMNHVALKDALPDDPGFEVPESYFDNLTDKLMEQLPETTDEVPVRKLNWWYIASTVAAGLVLLLSLNLWNSSNDFQKQIVQLETEEIESYFAVSSAVSNDLALEELFSDDPELLEEISVENSIEKEELLDYLSQEFELNDIIIE